LPIEEKLYHTTNKAINVEEDSKTIYIHALDYRDADEAIDSIKNTFEKAILEVSRP